MAIDFGMFLSLFVFLAVTTCCCSTLSTRVVEENEAMPTIAEDLQLEVQSNIYATDWSSLEQMAQFFKVELVLFRDTLLPRPQNGPEPRREKERVLYYLQAHARNEPIILHWIPGWINVE